MNGLMLGLLLASPQAETAMQAQSMRFECAVALKTPQGQLTNAAPVSISFSVTGAVLSDIRVVDAGGILYPGGNFRMVQKTDAIAMEGVDMPAERPGEWRGAAEKKMYRLTLKAGDVAKAAEIGIARTADKKSGRFGLIWNASNQPEGLPEPISGSGIGNCEFKTRDSQ